MVLVEERGRRPWGRAGVGCLMAKAGLLILLVCFGCDPGDGETLDDSGRPIEHPYAPGIGSKFGSAVFPPTYRGISSGFFDQFCANCHGGAAPSKGLDLSEDEGYYQLVDIPSVQRNALDRVTPGEPNSSYLIIKMEGGPSMAGRRMPRGLPPRPQEEIDTIRMWIDEGAPNN